ncbi:Molybdopterin molybdenumtransferase [Moorella humiferrea]|uniref:molybdopterin molybdotransferase MoeA n=1 Tax=Neomoorella humiferrea TaxID=676965 RepID=UPI0030D1FF08
MAPLSVEEARAALLAGLRPLGRIKVRLEEANGRVLAEAVRAPGPYPPFSRSLVDGYALGTHDANSDGSSFIYRLVGTVTAGSTTAIALKEGTAAAVFTGARLPEGTVAVVPVEAVKERQGEIVVLDFPASGRYLEQSGEEVKPGEEILAAGTVIGPGEISLLAALGFREITVYRRPRVALATTGNELRELGNGRAADFFDRAAIYGSNLYALTAAVEAYGGQVICLGILKDVLKEQVAACRRGLEEGDLLLITGGAGGSAFDFTSAAFSGAGGELLFTELAVRPGKRAVAARAGNKLMIGLPGTPPAAQVLFYLLVVPVLKAMGGRQGALSAFLAPLKKAVDRPRTERTFYWARVECRGGRFEVTPLPRYPGGIRAAVGANALIDLPPGAAPKEGEEVTVIMISDIE